MKLRPIYFAGLVVSLAILAAVFVLPGRFDEQYKFRPWKLGLDLIGGSHLVYEVDLSKVESVDKDSVLNGLRDVIEKRVNLFGVSEPEVYVAQSGDKSRLVVDLAGIKDISEAIEQIGSTPTLYFAEFGGSTSGGQTFFPTNLTGRYIKGASLAFNGALSEPQVSLEFNDEGAKLFEEITSRNVGKQVAIFLDGKLMEAPTVREKISGGKAQITGGFTIKDATSLVERFNAGALPAPITLVNQQTIGASLGIESLKQISFAGILGTIALMAFMVVYYHLFGVAASVALLIYIFLSLAIFKLLGITMSLSGIAGFILSIGMAVDANVLIFERTREEIKNGLVYDSAVEEGFRRAWPSIRDSNMTKIITSLILYNFTSSFVKGFALTLLLGVLVSMFTAITVTRTLLKSVRRNKSK